MTSENFTANIYLKKTKKQKLVNCNSLFFTVFYSIKLSNVKDTVFPKDENSALIYSPSHWYKSGEVFIPLSTT